MLLLTGCSGTNSTSESIHPSIAIPGSELIIEKVDFAENLEIPKQRTAMVCKNETDMKSVLEFVSNCLETELLKESIENLTEDSNMMICSLDRGEFLLEKDTGHWVYTTDLYDSSDGVSTSEFLTDDEIIDKTELFISEHELFNGDTYNISVTSTNTGGWNSEEKIISKDAYIFPNIDGLPVYGVYRMILTFNNEGEITQIVNAYNPVTEYREVSLVSEEAAKTKIINGEYSANMSSSMEQGSVQSVSLAYYADSAPNEAGEFNVYPVYVVKGTGSNLQGQVEEFGLIVDVIE